MSSAIHSMATLVLSLAVGMCSIESGGPSAPLNIVGLWNQGANLRDTVNGQTHIHTGYFSFGQEGSGFVGNGEQRGLCSGPNGHYEGPLADGARYDIGDGIQRGDYVSFKSELCTYEGTLSADDGHITGTARCAYVQDGVTFAWSGEWLANREPVAPITP